jgi:5-carboxymethyl-2-hydroxymuconate isomerase
MPNITVTFTPEVGEGEPVDWEAFATELQAAVVSLADVRPEACRVLFPSPDGAGGSVAGDLAGDRQAVHVEIALKAGRSDEVRAALSRAALDLVRKHVPASGDFTLHMSVEVREIDPVGYTSHIEPRRD